MISPVICNFFAVVSFSHVGKTSVHSVLWHHSIVETITNLISIPFFACYRYPLHRAPAEGNTRAAASLRVHARGAVYSAFTGGDQPARLVTVGQADGTLMVWDFAA